MFPRLLNSGVTLLPAIFGLKLCLNPCTIAIGWPRPYRALLIGSASCTTNAINNPDRLPGPLSPHWNSFLRLVNRLLRSSGRRTEIRPTEKGGIVRQANCVRRLLLVYHTIRRHNGLIHPVCARDGRWTLAFCSCCRFHFELRFSFSRASLADFSSNVVHCLSA